MGEEMTQLGGEWWKVLHEREWPNAWPGIANNATALMIMACDGLSVLACVHSGIEGLDSRR